MRLLFAFSLGILLAACTPASQVDGGAASSLSSSGASVSSFSFRTLPPDRLAKFDAAIRANASRGKTAQEGVPFGMHEDTRAELRPGAVDAKGTVVILENLNQTAVRFENFSVPYLPKLVVSFAADPLGNDARDFLELRATKGIVNHIKRGSLDLVSRPYLIIRSQDYGVVLGYALMKK